MAERRNGTVTEWQDIQLDTLSVAEKTELIGEIMDSMPAEALGGVEEMVSQKRRERMTEAETALMTKMLADIAASGIDARAFVRKLGQEVRGGGGASAEPVFRSPDGKQTWNGRGRVPGWLRKLEADGHSREEYRIRQEDASV